MIGRDSWSGEGFRVSRIGLAPPASTCARKLFCALTLGQKPRSRMCAQSTRPTRSGCALPSAAQVARKIDPAKYQNIVDLDQVFRAVMKQEEEEKEKLLKRANTLNQAQMAAAASAANAPAVVAVGQNGPEQA